MYAASGMQSDELRALMKSAGGRVPINGARSEALWCEPGVPLRCLAVPVPSPHVVPKARLRRDAPQRLWAPPSPGLGAAGYRRVGNDCANGSSNMSDAYTSRANRDALKGKHRDGIMRRAARGRPLRPSEKRFNWSTSKRRLKDQAVL